jgi:Family of unknown function (DUF5947)
MTVRLDDVAAQATARSLDDILAELDTMPESRARQLALDGVDALLQLYGEGLARLVTAHRDGRLSDQFIANDDVVTQLLGIHDLLPRSMHPPELVQLGRRQSQREMDDAVLGRVEEHAEGMCQLCALPVGADHRHLLDVEHRQLACACVACAILFDGRTAAGARYRLIPRRYRSLDSALLEGGVWERLEVPVDIAFIFVSSATNGPVAFYPGPMGTTESALPLPAWSEIVGIDPVLASLEPDVEAVLVRRTRGAREYMIVPVDECYRLAGSMRVTWQGISGGDEMRETVDAFFRRLARRDERPRAPAPPAADTQLEATCQTM